MSDVFILGAGFSKAINPLMPTMPELSLIVRRQMERLAKDAGDGLRIALPPPLQDIEDDSKALDDNIELWMTYLSENQPWLDEISSQYNQAVAAQIRRHIRGVIEARTLASMRPTRILANDTSTKPKWLNSLIQQWHLRRAKVITLNYDTLIERASVNLSIDEGRGVSLTQIYPPYFSTLALRRSGGGFGERELKTFTYLKLHGSTNWYYSGRDSFYGETIFLSHVTGWGTEGQESETLHASYGSDKSPLIIPPVFDKSTYFNNETVRRLWQEASSALWGATRVFVIGYSLPISDLGMQFFLKYSLPTKNTTWYIVDTSKRVLPRYRQLLASYQNLNCDFVCEKNPVEAFADSYPDLS